MAVRRTTLAGYSMQALANRGDQVVLTHATGEFTGRQAHERVRRIAGVLSDVGVTRGVCFAVLAGNLPDAYLTMLAGQMLGGVYTGLHPLGSVEDHVYALKDADARVLVYDARSYGERARAIADEVGIDQVFAIGVDGAAEFGTDLVGAASARSQWPTEIVAEADDVASIAYTGGTTGRPKGVTLTQETLLFQLMGIQANWDWPTTPRMLIVAPITHAAGQMILPAYALGGSVTILDKFDPQAFLRVIEERRINVTFVVPVMLYALLDHPDIDRYDTSSLKTVFYGASPIAPARLRAAIERFGPVFMQGYGQTEIGSGVIILRRDEHDLDDPRRLLSAGRAVSGVRLGILDDDGTLLAPGEVGELCLQGSQVMSGYWHLPDETAATLRGGWLHTGDLGFVDADGYLTLVDRKKDMIVSGGFNVYPREVETVIEKVPGVLNVAVIGVPSQKWGEEVRAVVVVTPDNPPSEKQIIDAVKAAKGSVQAPKSVDIVPELPVTAVGKIDKKSLRSRYWPTAGRSIG